MNLQSKYLVTRSEARRFWTMLPTHLQAEGIKVGLPDDHKLDSATVAGLVSLLKQGFKTRGSHDPAPWNL